MILLERIGLAATVLEAILKSSFPSSLTSALSEAERRRKALCQYVIHARSGGVADAVREHSFCSSPTRSGSAALECLAPPFFVLLTPARWEAMSLAASFSARYGCGVAVPAEPIQNLRQNRQPLEIISLCLPVPWFQCVASRDASACTHVGLCAYMCARNSGTSEPLHNIYILELVSGSRAGSARFSPEPALISARMAHAFQPISIKIVGRYARIGADRARRGLMQSRGGESFGVFGRAAWADRAARAMPTRRGRNGGKALVFAGASRVVGTPVLERMAQRRGNPRFFEAAHLPSGKAAGTPPCPLSRSRHLPARSRARVAGFGSAFGLISISASSLPGKNRREPDFVRRGRGKLRRARNPAIEPGRGSGNAAEKLRRTSDASGGAGYVK